MVSTTPPRWLAAALTVVLLGLSLPGSAAEVTAPGSSQEHATDHVLVKLEPGASPLGVIGTGTEQVVGGWRRVPVPEGRTPEEVMAELAQRPGVAVAELDPVIRLDPVTTAAVDDTLAVDDPGFDLQWHLPVVQAPEAWTQTTGTDVVVAVLDTGVSQGGDDLDCHTFVHPYDAITDSTGAAAASDDHGHGTHVAGTVAQCTDNGVGVAGTAFDVALMPVKVLDANGSGTYSDIARGIDWARSHGADIINLSLGGSSSSGVLDDAIEAATTAGILVVAAAGNSNTGTVAYPARHPDVVAVGAVDQGLDRAPYSNWGPEIEVVAPGGDLSEDVDGDGYDDGVLQETFTDTYGWGYYLYQGTSMATPHVAGVAALAWAAAPDATAADIRASLGETALDLGAAGVDSTFGHGLVQAADAISALTALDTEAPAWPDGATVDASHVEGDRATLTWPHASDDEAVATYRVARDGELVATTDVDTTSLTLTGLAPSTGYAFSVRAVDGAGNLSPALTAEVNTADTIAPTWGGETTIEVTHHGETSLDLRWASASDDTGVTGYRLRLQGADGHAVSGTSGTLTGLEPGTRYTVEVLARDAAGNWSEPRSATVSTAYGFTDIADSVFVTDIGWLSASGITRGCTETTFCPDDPVTRGQMAAFLTRALDLPPAAVVFDDATSSVFAADIAALAAAGITSGCGPSRFCPDDPVTRGQMAAFLHRALGS